MSHYKSNVRDLEFNLFEVFDLEKVLATGAFGDLDGDTVREMLAEASKLARDRSRSPSLTATETRRRSTPKPTW